MGIITLTTDLGQKDFYLASVKGSILKELPEASIQDISHSVPAFNIAQAAFLLKNSFFHFPSSTIHIIGVDCDYSKSPRFLIAHYRDHYFIGPDNGVFSLIFEEAPNLMVEIYPKEGLKPSHFNLLEILVPASCSLYKSPVLEKYGLRVEDWNQKMNLKPVFGPGFIRGTIIYVDEYQNVISNIQEYDFKNTIGLKNFQIRFRRNESINKISYHYGEVPEGEKLALFGISGHLEIAIHKGKAAGLLGLKIDDIIQIDYEEKKE